MSNGGEFSSETVCTHVPGVRFGHSSTFGIVDVSTRAVLETWSWVKVGLLHEEETPLVSGTELDRGKTLPPGAELNCRPPTSSHPTTGPGPSGRERESSWGI